MTFPVKAHKIIAWGFQTQFESLRHWFREASLLHNHYASTVSMNETAIAAPGAGFEDGEFPPRFDCKARRDQRVRALCAFAGSLPRGVRSGCSLRIPGRNWRRYLYARWFRLWNSGWKSCPAPWTLLHTGLRRRFLRLCRYLVGDRGFSSGAGRLPHPVRARAGAPRAAAAQALFCRARATREHLIAPAPLAFGAPQDGPRIAAWRDFLSFHWT